MKIFTKSQNWQQTGNEIVFNKLTKIHGPIVKSNLGAVKVYLKANWIIEGVQKGHYLINNKQEDAILVACFNPKYFKIKFVKIVILK